MLLQHGRHYYVITHSAQHTLLAYMHDKHMNVPAHEDEGWITCRKISCTVNIEKAAPLCESADVCEVHPGVHTSAHIHHI